MQLRLAPSRAAVVIAALAAAFAAAPVVGVSAPAAASAGPCSPGTGVTIVVDRNPGDNVDGAEYCASSSGGKTVKVAMEAAPVSKEEVSSEPGFVCRIEGHPSPSTQSCAETPPAEAYWRLYWSNGRSTSWSASSYGYAALKVPTGGSVGWAYQGGGSGAPDQAPAVRPAPSPSKPAGGSGGSTKPSPTPSQPSATPSTSAPAPSTSAPATSAPSASAAELTNGEKAATTKAGDEKSDEKSDKKAGEQKKDTRKDDDESRAKQRGSDRDDSDDLVDASEDEAVTSGELATPVSAEPGGMTGSDLALLGVAGVCIAGLAASALVMARRRRS